MHLSNGRCFFIGASDVGMIDFFQPDNFQTLSQFVMWTVGGTCLLVSGLASWTLIYIINIAGNMAETKASCQLIAASLSEFKQENEQDHLALHGRITKVEEVNHDQGLAIHSLQKGSC